MHILYAVRPHFEQILAHKKSSSRLCIFVHMPQYVQKMRLLKSGNAIRARFSKEFGFELNILVGNRIFFHKVARRVL